MRLPLTLVAGLLCGCPESSPLLLDHVVPGAGSARGGEQVTLVGTGFAAETVVRIDGVEVSSEWFDGETMMIFTPPGIAGAVDITVTRVDGAESSLADAYQYVAFDPWFVNAPASALPVGGSSLYTSLGAGDFDGDLDPDAVVSGPQGGLVRWENQDLGQFRVAQTVSAAVSDVAVADLDGDGLDDVFACGAADTVHRLFLGSAQGLTEASPPALPDLADPCIEVIAQDVDDDTRADLILLAADANRSYLRILLNQGAPGAPRFVVHEGMEAPADLDGTVFGAPLAEDGATDVTVEATLGLGFGAAAGRIEGSFGGAGGSVGVRFARDLFAEPTGVSVEVLGGGMGTQMAARVVDGNGETFVWGLGTLDGEAATVSSGPLESASPDGDGVFDLPVEAVDLLWVGTGAGAVDVAFDSVVLATDQGRVRIEDFERRDFVVESAARDRGLAVGDVDADGAVDVVLAGPDGVRVALRTDTENAHSDGSPGWALGLTVAGDATAAAVLETLAGADVLAEIEGGLALLRLLGGALSDVTEELPTLNSGSLAAAAVGDLDRDGGPDVLFLRDGQDDLVHRSAVGVTSWTMRLPPTEEPTLDAAFLDVDRDGDDDILLLGEGPSHRLVLSVDEAEAR